MNTLMYNLSKCIPDKVYLQLMYYKHFHKFIDFKNPKTFNEKINWLKLYNRKPEYTQMVDKYAVREYVADKLGKEYLVPLLGVWKDPHEINFDKLPNQFVLKWNHDSGSVVVCKDKTTLNIAKTVAMLASKKRRNGYWYGREWPYKNVRPLIIAEQYMEDVKTSELRDYKFFCFDGVAKAMFIATERQKKNEEVKFDFYDMDFKYLNIRQGHPNADVSPSKPDTFEEMRRLAEKISTGIPHLRVDFYEVNGKVYFGELTFFHFSGMVPFNPEKWDDTFGNWVKLPDKFRR